MCQAVCPSSSRGVVEVKIVGICTVGYLQMCGLLIREGGLSK